ncbi:indoleamine 2,3-dioxygenase 2 isoform X7 [Bubalus bubalis]|uniref:indoleamine 2,3-dioxygenase 2 isoform X7 n=1 Tax=Bubalus bubalis TaxID=89462 RepID=UPI001E1B73E4|nr:indoleamine 2,3-dioxygenase 2 isoform X7 [Bubalus bubalis]
MEPQSQDLKTAPFLTLGRFHISEDYGFLLPSPLRELPGHYSPWMEIANRLPQLIESRQLRAQVNEMPLLNCQFLTGYREWRLARLVLSFITMGYVWQDGETQPKEILPRNLALPFVEVSRNLGLPPILVHSDLVLANWTTRNPGGPLEIRNLDTIVSFPGGESLRGFVLVTVLVEKAAVPGIKALVQAVNAILQPSPDSLLQALQQLRVSIQDITGALGQMHDYVDPDIFYAVIRIFLSGAFVEEIRLAPSLRTHVLSSGNRQLLTAYNQCVESLAALRTYHLALVTKYLITAASKAKAQRTSHLPRPPQALEERGTGGTAVVSFLKSVRDKTLEALLHPSG